MSDREKLLVIGWGRMGLTHTSIINGLYPNRFETIIVEPNWKIRRITDRTLGYKTMKNISDAPIKNSKVIISTPPFVHDELTEFAIENDAQSVFVEKPFGLYDKKVIENEKITVGYVLRFTEVVQKLKTIISEEGCKKIVLNYSSNSLTKTPKGWRNSVYGGVLNEMGSHLIDIILYLIEGKEFKINYCKIKSIISDYDDIVVVRGSIDHVDIDLSLDWVNNNYRKPVWSGSIETSSRKISFDQQSIDLGFTPSSLDYYVRGREFSVQMKHFIESNKNIGCTSNEANRVHDIITEIKNYS